MNENFGKHSNELEIADLIGESVVNAAKRRQRVMEESLVDLTEEQARNIEGGLTFIPVKPTTLGFIKPWPFPIGIIIVDPYPISPKY